MRQTGDSFTAIAMLAATVLAAPAYAQVYKCKGAGGTPVYQAAPCDDTGGGIKVPERGPDKAGGSKAITDADRKSMSEAFQSRMDKRDYEGALAFATTDQQKSQARKKIAEKDAKCQGLAVKVKEAQAKVANGGARYKNDLDKAEDNYRLSCR